MKKYIPRYAIVIFIIVSSIFVLTECINRNNDKSVIRNRTFGQFAGSATCANCHSEIHNNYIHTAHNLTSFPASEKYIKGSFEPGNNKFAYDNNLSVVMEKRNDGFYQVAYTDGVETEAWRIDIVVGSGKLGQSFLSWKDKLLFQLPITYFTAANQWSNSTGYPDQPVFNRTITSRCLECHNTFAKSILAPGKFPDSIAEPGKFLEEFDHNQIIYAVGCEKCHGPAAEHVKFQTENPKETKGKYIINPAALSMQQKLDLCVLCHGGKLQKSKPSFEFTPGDTLSNYFNADTTVTDPANIDVHGDQYGSLRSSKCFRTSKTMTCITCHNSHENERGKINVFSGRCLTCHNTEHNNFCKLNETIGSAINKNCIDCHMPVKPSNVATVFLPHSNEPTAALIRSHYITIYPDETKKVLDTMKKLRQIN